MTRLKQSFAAGLALALLALGAATVHADAPLADAAEKLNWRQVRTSIEEKTDVNQAQADGMTALHWAVYHDDVATAKLLIAARANASAKNRYGVTPLSLACMNGNTKIIELLLEAGADPNSALSGNETPLMTAGRTGKLDAVKILLSRGAEVNAKERNGQSAIMWAAAEGHADVVAALIEHGAEFREPLASGFTPLLFAVREGRADVVQTLLKAGADVNEMLRAKKPTGELSKSGPSPLILAVENGHFELAIALIEAGADPNDQRSGATALHAIVTVRKPNRGDGEDGAPPPQGSGKMNSLDFVRALVARGANVNARLKKGAPGPSAISKEDATPFLLASVTADAPLMRLLVELGADPLLPNAENCTPLLAASGVGSRAPEEEAGAEPEVLEALALVLELGCDVNAVDDKGETSMHGAAYKNLPNVVQFLADKGARIDVWNRKNKSGWTPLLIAEGHRPGNFKPSARTITALHKVMLAAGVTPPAEPTPRSNTPQYAPPAAKNAPPR